MSRTGGTLLSHVKGNNLEALEQGLAKLKYSVTIVGVTRLQSGEWYVHFTRPDWVEDGIKTKKEVSEKTKILKGS